VARKLRVAHHAQHLLHDLSAFFLAVGLGEEGQKSADGILRQRVAELPGIQVQCRGGLVHDGAGQIVRRHPQHQLFGRHVGGLNVEHMQPDLAFEGAQIGLDVPAVRSPRTPQPSGRRPSISLAKPCSLTAAGPSIGPQQGGVANPVTTS